MESWNREIVTKDRLPAPRLPDSGVVRTIARLVTGGRWIVGSLDSGESLGSEEKQKNRDSARVDAAPVLLVLCCARERLEVIFVSLTITDARQEEDPGTRRGARSRVSG